MNERKKVITHRLIWGFLIVIAFVICVVNGMAQPEVVLLDDECYIEYEYNDGSVECDLVLTFNTDVDSGYVTVNFYDELDNLVDTQEIYIIGYDSVVHETIYVDEGVDSYEVVDYDVYAYNGSVEISIILFAIMPIFVALFVSSLLLSYKEFDYNGQKISVYAGFYHHNIRVNGEIFDEHNTLATFSPISLSCTLDNGDKVGAVISLTNRITVKINDRLYNSKKKDVNRTSSINLPETNTNTESNERDLTKRCPECQALNDSHDKYCQYCGRDLL